MSSTIIPIISKSYSAILDLQVQRITSRRQATSLDLSSVEVPFVEEQETRRGRKRKTRTWDDLRVCICGIAIEDQASREVIICRNKGCETKLVSSSSLKDPTEAYRYLQYHIDCIGLERRIGNWMCRACKIEKHGR